MTDEFIKIKDMHHFHPSRKVTLVDGSYVSINLVTGIPFRLDEQLGKVAELEGKYEKIKLAEQSILDFFNEEEE
mgnify:CR=1 FL=1